MVQKKFLKDLFILQILNWLIKPLWILGIERYVQNHTGDSVYGKYYVVFNFVLLFAFLLDFGINNYLSTEIAKTGNTAIVNPLLKLRLGLTSLYLLLILAIGLSINLSPLLLLLISISQVFSGTTLFFRSILQGLHEFKKDAIISVLDRFVAIASFCICILFFGYSTTAILNLFIWVQLGGYAVSMTVAGLLCLGLRKRAHDNSIPLPKIQLNTILKKTFLFAALALLMSLFTRFDVILLKNLLPDGEYHAGIYARGFRLLDAGLIFSGMLSVQLMPLFGKMHSNNEELKKLLWLAGRIILVITLPAAFISFFYYHEILTLLYKQTHPNLNHSFILLMFTFIPMASVHVFGTFLTSLHRLRYLIMAATFCVGVNLLADLWLIPSWGARGAAAGCLITQFVFSSLCLIKTFSLLKIKLQKGPFFSLLLFALITAGGTGLLKHNFSFTLNLFLIPMLVLMGIFISGIFKTELKKLQNQLPFFK